MVEALARVVWPVIFSVVPVNPPMKAFVAKRPPAERFVVEALPRVV